MSEKQFKTMISEIREMRKTGEIGNEVYTTVKERLYKLAKKHGIVKFY